MIFNRISVRSVSDLSHDAVEARRQGMPSSDPTPLAELLACRSGHPLRESPVTLANLRPSTLAPLYPPRPLAATKRFSAEFPFSYRHQLADFSPARSASTSAIEVVPGAAPLTPAAAAAAAAELPCSLHDGERPERDAFSLCVFEHLCR